MKVLGLMSGTSADGVDVALLSINGNKIKLNAFKTFAYPLKLREKILSALNLPLPQISQLNFEIGGFFANSALRFLKEKRIPSKKIFCVGSHGQTIFHKTSGPQREWSTFQIGEGSIIAAKLQLPVVADFRPQDMALGGQGAPLTPYFHYSFFKNRDSLCVHNLGGISNVTFIPLKNQKSKVLAFDTGPANCLIDGVMRKISKGQLNFDRGGRLASQGKVHWSLVKKWLKHPYFSKSIPKSCGQDEFGPQMVSSIMKECHRLNKKDILATVTAFTSQSIIQSYEKLILKKHKLKEIVFCGGGVKNKTLMKQIKEGFQKYFISFKTFDDYGIDSHAVEAASFAYMAYQCIRNQTNHLPQTTGASRETILGKIIRP